MPVCDLADRAAGLTQTIGKSRNAFLGVFEMVQERHLANVPQQGMFCNSFLYPTGGLGGTGAARQCGDVLPNNIRTYREAAKMTQAALADAINTGRSTLVKLERGERPLTGEWLEKIGGAVGVPPYALIAPPGVVPTVPELEQMLAFAQQSLPAGLPYSEWPRAVASELHTRLRTLADDRANADDAHG